MEHGLLDTDSVDLVLTDLPYGVTQNKWDSVIPLDFLWGDWFRIGKERCPFVLFGQDKFSAKLMLSQVKYHKYNLIWNKVITSGFLNANRMPLRSHEDICVFYRKSPTYNPQKVKGKKSHSKGRLHKKYENNGYGDFNPIDTTEELGDMKHPKSILTFEKPHPSVSKHPTEKPVPLLEWIILSYTNEGDTVLDSTAGSGPIVEACLNTGRNCIAIEQEEKYFNIMKQREIDWYERTRTNKDS